MMWKESYRLGVEHIDAQHKKLFETAGELIQEIEGAQRPEVYKRTIKFLQEYVVVHFRDEEAYFKSLHFANEAEHIKQHQEITQAVQKYVMELESSAYASHVIKKMAGMLSAWLIYHVVKEDLQYTGKAKQEPSQNECSYMEHFTNSTIQVLEAMIGLNPADVDKAKIYDNLSKDDVFIEIGLVGDLKGRVVFGFTKEFSSRLVESMMSFAPDEIDELVCSALSEVSNIASGKGTIAMSEEGIACDICPPKVLQNSLEAFPPHEEVRIDTKIGKMTIAVYLD